MQLLIFLHYQITLYTTSHNVLILIEVHLVPFLEHKMKIGNGRLDFALLAQLSNHGSFKFFLWKTALQLLTVVSGWYGGR